jgi:hypothetical protein
MPFTVSCPACSARFSLGDDLYRRKVAGNLVTVKCRHCSAEIAVDATEPATMPSQEAPRRAPSPPRPKGSSVTRMGLGMPAPPAGLSATATPLGLSATATPRGLGSAPKPASIEVSIWDTDQTVQINAPKPPPPRLHTAPHPPHAPHPPRKKEEEPELIDAEEIPPSSSDAPTLDALTLDTGRPKPPPGKRAPDDFLVNLSAGTQGILGAPTIDVSNLDSPPPPSVESIDVDVEEELEFHQADRARGGTVPLFDMSAVLPAASGTAKSGANAAAARTQASDSPASVSVVPGPESKARERKYVVAPQTPATAPKSKRAGGAVWFVLVAAAAGIVAVVGLRGHQPAPHAAPEPTLEKPAIAPAAIPEAPSAAVVQEPAASETASAETPSAPAPKAANTTITTAIAPTLATTSVKAEAVEKPAVAAEPAVEKPVIEKPAAPSKPVEAHNAPPPAADGTEFDRAAARSALAGAAAQASACRKDGDPSGTATITITFAPSGRITSANLQGPPFAGTATGGCIANTMRHATVPAFSGEHVTVTKTIVVQ